MLPKEDDLRAEYPVSKPSLREALRILETEGLITVMRGNKGGALVHRPTEVDAGYMLGLVLTGQRTEVADLAAALQEIEPACAALCAARRDPQAGGGARARGPAHPGAGRGRRPRRHDHPVAPVPRDDRRVLRQPHPHAGGRGARDRCGRATSGGGRQRWTARRCRCGPAGRSWRCTARSSRASARAIGRASATLVADHLRHVQQYPATGVGGGPSTLDPALLRR